MMSDVWAWLCQYPFAIWGFIGGVLGSHVKDDGLELPSIKDHKLHLGALFGAAAGGAAGHLVDRAPMNAFIWGIVSGVVIRLIVKNANVIGKKALCSILPPGWLPKDMCDEGDNGKPENQNPGK